MLVLGLFDKNIPLSNLMVQVSLLFYYRVRPPLPSKYDLGLIFSYNGTVPGNNNTKNNDNGSWLCQLFFTGVLSRVQ